MQRLFISDLHLDEKRPEILRAFFHFMETRARAADELYILGDFFEMWVGDDDDSDLAQQVAAALRALTENGTDLYLMHGNRDFLLGDDFCKAVGATLLPDPFQLELAGQPTLLMHGDSLCIDDPQYQQFRAMVRSPAWQQEAMSKSLEERRALARQLRMASNEANSNKAADIMDVNPAEVQRQMLDYQCLRLIHGHTHRPQRHHIDLAGESAERIVLGDWDSQGWVLDVRDDVIDLQHFPL
ncbi:UDP-2,3-diacylglucosamine diphosphatase [Spongiibacter sp. KMU-166]|uniref:UDP-2,3-diacylglucosamine hydrolase n=1 Tax=Spongiibacter thalassae TaxID=2721624 RepID=A0ABX1GFJ3_9GAMM|nr:UDP-2,3-diacylglucosamine diphosphatase [Spongiibacter thalassae]NKI17916.1 UDP-2,3-diacylglucosamine diphosphatase [Spongiibacter thalassae]